jgi:DNA-binding MarR family transcriptional regulator
MSTRGGTAPGDRAALLRALDEALRKVGAQSVMLSDAVARRVGLHSTDLECLDLLLMAGPTTAGTLAARTGLTTGAMTAVIDRLEQAGLVHRERVADDRRCVLVHVVRARVRHIEALYQPLADAVAKVNSEFTDEALATVVDYLTRALDACAQHVNTLQAPTRSARTPVRPDRRRAASGEPSPRRMPRASVR